MDRFIEIIGFHTDVRIIKEFFLNSIRLRRRGNAGACSSAATSTLLFDLTRLV
jgi:hypothetical protein